MGYPALLLAQIDLVTAVAFGLLAGLRGLRSEFRAEMQELKTEFN